MRNGFRSHFNFVNIEADIVGLRDASGSLFDMDNDGDLDLLVSGYNDETNTSGTWFYRNKRVRKNTAPTSPDHLTTFVFQDSVTFAWTPATDEETASQGLFYNLRVGTTPDGDEVMPSHAIAQTGKLLKQCKGNAGQNLGWKLKDLEAGKYYCAVQAIDPAYGASKFSTIHEFEIHDKADISLHSQVQDSIFPGAKISGVAIVGNPGLENINSSFSVKTYFSTDKVADESEVIEILELESLSSGTYDTISINVNIPLDHPVGPSYILFEIDPDNSVTEYKEDNNLVIDSTIVKADVFAPIIDLSICREEYSPIDTIVTCSARITDNIQLEEVYYRYGINEEPVNKQYEPISSGSGSIFSFDIVRSDLDIQNTFYIQYMAVDYFGNGAESKVLEVVYTQDTIAPEIDISICDDRFLPTDTIVDCQANITDNVWLKEVYYRFGAQEGLDEVSYQPLALGSGNIYAFDIERSDIYNVHNYYIQYKAIDYFDNVAESEVFEIAYVRDFIEPVISDIVVPETYMMGDTLLTVSCKVTDNNFTPSVSLNYFTEKDPNQKYEGKLTEAEEPDKYVFEIDRTDIQAKEPISVQIKAVDFFDNETVSDTYIISNLVDNHSPIIRDAEHPPYYISGEPFLISFRIWDEDKLSNISVVVFGDNQRDTIYVASDSLYQVMIDPAKISNPQDLSINIDATDASGNHAKTVLLYISRQVDNYPVTLHVGENVEDYQMISFPFDHESKEVGYYLRDLGEPSEMKYYLINSDNWAMYKYQDGANLKMSLTDQVSRGVGYWLISAEEDTINLRTKSLESSFNLPIKSGWNLIGNPYPFTISWQDVLDNNPILKDQISKHINTYKQGTVYQTSHFEAFTGGFIWSEISGSLDILALPVGNNGRKAKLQEGNFGEGEWILPITMSAGKFKNEIGGIGMMMGAKSGKDQFDEYNIPRFLKFIEPEFYNQESEVRLLRNIVEVKDSYIWELDISTNLAGEQIVMSWPRNFQLSEDKSIAIYDATSGWLTDMKERNSIIKASNNDAKYRIIYGSKDFIAANTEQKDSGILQIYPVPSNGTINVDIVQSESSSNLQFRLINLDGKMILDGVSQIKGAGSIVHQIDLKKQHPGLQSGLYYILIDFNKKTYSKKLLIN